MKGVWGGGGVAGPQKKYNWLAPWRRAGPSPRGEGEGGATRKALLGGQNVTHRCSCQSKTPAEGPLQGEVKVRMSLTANSSVSFVREVSADQEIDLNARHNLEQPACPSVGKLALGPFPTLGWGKGKPPNVELFGGILKREIMPCP